jgi:hypothetical protein
MAGKPGRSGPVGNTNATKHPYRTYLRRRVVPVRHRGVLRLGEECLAKIQSDLPDMSGKEEMVAEGVKILMTCGLLGLAEAKERGFITTLPDGSWDFQPGLKAAGSFLDKAIKGLVALGLDRRATVVPTLSDYLTKKDPA